MPDLKISELTELPDSGTGDGIDNSDYLAIIDQSESDITLINKKVRVSTLHEFLAPLDTPVLTGTPFSTTPPPGNNSTRIATTEYVQNELASALTLDSLTDVTVPSTPTANQILVFDEVTGTFVARNATTTNRQILTGTFTLQQSSAEYQFLDPNGADRELVLPVGIEGLKFTIKNLNTTYNINITESLGGAVQATLNLSTPIAEVVHDGTEYHIILF